MPAGEGASHGAQGGPREFDAARKLRTGDRDKRKWEEAPRVAIYIGKI